MLSSIQATTATPVRRSAKASAAPTPAAADRVSLGESADPIARVDRLIADLHAGRVQYAPEIAANVRKTELTLSNFPCKKYVVRPGQGAIDARELPTEIVPKGEKSRYKKAVTVESKLTEKETRKDLERRKDSIRGLTDELKRQNTESVLVLIEGDNANGKDGILKHVFELSPLTTSGVRALKAAKGEEAKHEPNWRVMQTLPGAGQIGFHNRTHYGDVVFAAKTPADKAQRLADIKELEYGLTMGLPMTPEGHIAMPDAQGRVDPSAIQRPPMRFIKIMLNVSKAEQAARLADRLVNERKSDKMSAADLEGHDRHEAVQTDFANAMAATSTPWAPAYVLPHDNKETGWRKMAQITEGVLADIDPQRPGTDMSLKARREAAAPLLEEVRQARRR